jgi:hypothetical protein
MARKLEFGWFLPTSGDSTAFGDPSASVQIDPEHILRVVTASEGAGFEYLLIPVDRHLGRPISPAPSLPLIPPRSRP